MVDNIGLGNILPSGEPQPPIGLFVGNAQDSFNFIRDRPFKLAFNIHFQKFLKLGLEPRIRKLTHND